MKLGKKSFLIMSAILIFSCKKESNTPSSQTISLLQNKWTLISSNVIFPTYSPYNSSYKGIGTDYYLFGSNDSLTIHQAGQYALPTIPISLTIKYSIIDNNTITYILSPNPNIQINIKSLTNNLLVLSNSCTATVTSSGVVTATYNGIKTDSLKR